MTLDIDADEVRRPSSSMTVSRVTDGMVTVGLASRPSRVYPS